MSTDASRSYTVRTSLYLYHPSIWCIYRSALSTLFTFQLCLILLTLLKSIPILFSFYFFFFVLFASLFPLSNTQNHHLRLSTGHSRIPYNTLLKYIPNYVLLFLFTLFPFIFPSPPFLSSSSSFSISQPCLIPSLIPSFYFFLFLSLFH